MEEETLKQCKKLTQDLIKHKDSEAFRVPVPWKEWGLLDYPHIIKKPMDLSTVMSNLDKHIYNSINEYAEDVKLIWTNCMIYNQETSDYYRYGKIMQKYFDQKLRKLTGKDDSKDPINKEKALLANDLTKISYEQLGKVVAILYEKCKESITKLNTTDIEVQVDKIDTDSFRYIESYVKSCLGSENSEITPPAKKIRLNEQESVQSL